MSCLTVSIDGRRRLRLRLVGAVLIGLLWFVIAPTGLGGSMTLVAVDGQSMEPLLHTGDLAVAFRSHTYRAGDLVVFRVGSGGLVIHRLVLRGPHGVWRTQGDNKPSMDPWTVNDEQIKGRFIARVPKLGLALHWVQRQPFAIGGLAALLTLLLFSGWRADPSPGESRQPDTGDAWTIVAMCLIGGAAALLITVILIRGGAAPSSMMPLTFGLAGLVSTALGVHLLVDLLDSEPQSMPTEGT